MPELRYIVGMGLNDKALDDGALEESYLSTCCNPCKDLDLLNNDEFQIARRIIFTVIHPKIC
jgi:hypothetical protein